MTPKSNAGSQGFPTLIPRPHSLPSINDSGSTLGIGSPAFPDMHSHTGKHSALSENLLALVVRTDPSAVAEILGNLTEADRAHLAVFCNARSHLREHGRAIAATCSRFSLERVGGAAGAALFDRLSTMDIVPVVDRPTRKAVTLAGSTRPEL